MLENLSEKQKIILVGIVGVVGFVLFSSRPKSSIQGNLADNEPNYHNDTLYIPTSSYDIHINNGTLTQNTTTQTTNSNVEVGDNSTVTNPAPVVNVPTPTSPVVSIPKPTTPAPTLPKLPTAPVVKYPAFTSYTVKKGDTLWSIAVKFYGNGQQYKKIASDNHISNPNLIKVGQTLKIYK